MQFIAIADPHFHLYKNQARETHNGITDRLEDVGRCFDTALEYARDNNIRTLVVLGDVFHSKDILNVVVYNYVFALFERLSLFFNNIVILAGNHDQAHKTNDAVSIQGLSPFATIITDATVLDIDGVTFHCLPYVEKDFVQKCTAFRPVSSTPNVFLGHVGIAGAKYSGFETRAKGEIELKDIQTGQYDLSLFGHFHEFQALSPKAYYVGAPMQHNFSDVGSVRGFCAVTVTAGRRGADVQVKQIPVCTTPEFLSVTEAEYLVAPESDDLYIKLVDVSRAKATQYMSEDPRIVGAKITFNDNTKLKSSVTQATTPEQLIEAYLDYMNEQIVTLNLPRPLLQKYGLSILNKIKSERLVSKHSFTFKVNGVGFKAFGDTGFSIDYSKEGLTLIRGVNHSSNGRSSNGTGKSTLLEALLFGLYGKYGKGLKKDMVNLKSPKAEVTVEIVRDGVTFGKVVRTVYKSSTPNKLAFSIDKEELSGSLAQIQNQIELFLGLSKDSFLLSLYCAVPVGQLTSGILEGIFSEILGLQAYVEARDLVSKDLGAVQTRITQQTFAINTIQQTLLQLEADLLLQEENYNTLHDRQNADETLKVSQDLLRTLQTDSQQAKEELAKVQIQLNNQDAAYKKETLVLGTLQEDVNMAETNQAVLQTKVQTQETVYLKVKHLIADKHCPACQASTERDDLYKVLEQEALHLERLTSEYQGSQLLCADVKGKYYEYEAIVASLENELNTSIRAFNAIQQVIQQKQQEIIRLQGQVLLVESKQEQAKSACKEAYDAVIHLEEQYDELDEKLGQQELVRGSLYVQAEIKEFWLVGFGSTGIRNLVIDGALPELNKIAASYSDVLIGGEITVGFTSTTETAKGESRNKLAVTVEDIYGHSTYEGASSGEQRRMNIILSLALQRFISLRQNLGVILLDEIFVKLDDTGRESVVKLLRYVLKDIPSIFIVSNQEGITRENFDNIITVTRRGVESYIS